MEPETDLTFLVLLYGSDPGVRERMRLAIGTRPAPDVGVEFVEAGTYDECLRLIEDQDVDLMVLDGDAQPAGGMGIARQLRDELLDPPPAIVVLSRAADRWLAAYARVDAILEHPLDPLTTGTTVVNLLREEAAA